MKLPLKNGTRLCVKQVKAEGADDFAEAFGGFTETVVTMEWRSEAIWWAPSTWLKGSFVVLDIGEAWTKGVTPESVIVKGRGRVEPLREPINVETATFFRDMYGDGWIWKLGLDEVADRFGWREVEPIRTHAVKS